MTLAPAPDRTDIRDEHHLAHRELGVALVLVHDVPARTIRGPTRDPWH
jgi:hypothetical protein